MFVCKNHICTWWWCQLKTYTHLDSVKNWRYSSIYMLPLAGEASSAILVLSFWLVQSFVMSSKWLSKSTNSVWSPDSSIWQAIARVSSHCLSIILSRIRKWGQVSVAVQDVFRDFTFFGTKISEQEYQKYIQSTFFFFTGKQTCCWITSWELKNLKKESNITDQALKAQHNSIT